MEHSQGPVPRNVAAAASTANLRRRARVTRAAALLWARHLGPAESGLVVDRRPTARQLWEAAGVSRATWMSNKLSPERVHHDLRDAGAETLEVLALHLELRQVPDRGSPPGVPTDPNAHEVLLGAAAALANPLPEDQRILVPHHAKQAAELLSSACLVLTRSDVTPMPARVELLGSYLTRLETHARVVGRVPVVGDRVLWARGFLHGATTTSGLSATPDEAVAAAAWAGDPLRYQEGWIAGAIAAGRWDALNRTVDNVPLDASSPTGRWWHERGRGIFPTASMAEVLLEQLTLAYVGARVDPGAPGSKGSGGDRGTGPHGGHRADEVCYDLARTLLSRVAPPAGHRSYLDRRAWAVRATVEERWDDVLEEALAGCAYLVRPGARDEHALDELVVLAWHAIRPNVRKEDLRRRKLMERHLRAELAAGRGPFMPPAARHLAQRATGAGDRTVSEMLDRAVTPRLLGDLQDVTRTLQVARAFNAVPSLDDIRAAHERLDSLMETVEAMRAALPSRGR